MKISFSKYEAAGNNFIYIDMTSTHYDITSQQIRDMCRWKTGIGSDGVVVLTKSRLPECRYKLQHYLPRCGTAVSELCGNGSRCTLAFADKVGLCRLEEGGSPILFEACDGEHWGGKLSVDHYFISIRDVSLQSISESDKYYYVNVGSPHYVCFVEDIHSSDEVSAEGLEFRHTEICIIDFVQVKDEGDGTRSLALRAYEPGIEEETHACGTGATASSIVAFFRQHLLRNPADKKSQGGVSVKTRVSMKGGELEVEFTAGDQVLSDIRLSGPVRHAFDGVVTL